MAKKYETGATAGRKASKYKATLPNGSEVVVKSFFVHDPEAYIWGFIHNNNWHTSGVTSLNQCLEGQQKFLANKIN